MLKLRPTLQDSSTAVPHVCSDGSWISAGLPASVGPAIQTATSSAYHGKLGLLAFSPGKHRLSLVSLVGEPEDATSHTVEFISEKTQGSARTIMSPLCFDHMTWHPTEALLAVAFGVDIAVYRFEKRQPSLLWRRRRRAGVSTLAWTPQGTQLGYALWDGEAGCLGIEGEEGAKVISPSAATSIAWVSEGVAVMLTADRQLCAWREHSVLPATSKHLRFVALIALGRFGIRDADRRLYFAALDSQERLHRGWLDEDGTRGEERDGGCRLFPDPILVTKQVRRPGLNSYVALAYHHLSPPDQIPACGSLIASTPSGWAQYHAAYGLLMSYKRTANPEMVQFLDVVRPRLERGGMILWQDTRDLGAAPQFGWTELLEKALSETAGAIVFVNDQGWGRTHRQEAIYLWERRCVMKGRKDALDLWYCLQGADPKDSHVAVRLFNEERLFNPIRLGVEPNVIERLGLPEERPRFPADIMPVDGRLDLLTDAASADFIRAQLGAANHG